ncbi:YicS family protein [Erwinia sp.]|uniref:YicS family protein n=1 Tax=Erwinia citreus TaxID=558 RepID=UPI003C76F18E
MNYPKAILTLSLLLVSASSLAAPYDSLSFALRQQQIINDLRSHCQIDKSVTDEKIKTTFLHDKSTESQILAAAAGLRNNNKQAYSEAMEDIQCPDIE